MQFSLRFTSRALLKTYHKDRSEVNIEVKNATSASGLRFKEKWGSYAHKFLRKRTGGRGNAHTKAQALKNARWCVSEFFGDCSERGSEGGVLLVESGTTDFLCVGLLVGRSVGRGTALFAGPYLSCQWRGEVLRRNGSRWLRRVFEPGPTDDVSIKSRPGIDRTGTGWPLGRTRPTTD